MDFCIKNGGSGVTLQGGRYEVRGGPYIHYFEDNSLKSWVYL
jgi:hypothetical protein